MLRIQRSEKGEVVFTLSGQMDEEAIAGLQSLIRPEESGRRIALDLRDLTLVNEDGVIFLESCESNGITLENCPAYVREWIVSFRQACAEKLGGPISRRKGLQFLPVAVFFRRRCSGARRCLTSSAEKASGSKSSPSHSMSSSCCSCSGSPVASSRL
jgi:hypothetical protein